MRSLSLSVFQLIIERARNRIELYAASELSSQGRSSGKRAGDLRPCAFFLSAPVIQNFRNAVVTSNEKDCIMAHKSHKLQRFFILSKPNRSKSAFFKS